MPANRQRIVHRLLVIVSIPVLLLSGYMCRIGGLLCVSAAGRLPRFVSGSQTVRAYTLPVFWFVDSGLPGSTICRWILGECQNAGWRLRDK